MKKKGLIISTIVMVVVLIASLTTATYAWFNANAAVSVKQIGVSVASATNISIGIAEYASTNRDTAAGYKNGTMTYTNSNGTTAGHFTGTKNGLGSSVEWDWVLSSRGGVTSGTLVDTTYTLDAQDEYNTAHALLNGQLNSAGTANEGLGYALYNGNVATGSEANTVVYAPFGLRVEKSGKNYLYCDIKVTASTVELWGIVTALKLEITSSNGNYSGHPFAASTVDGMLATAIAYDTTPEETATDSGEAKSVIFRFIIKYNADHICYNGEKATTSPAHTPDINIYNFDIRMFLDGYSPNCVSAATQFPATIDISFDAIDTATWTKINSTTTDPLYNPANAVWKLGTGEGSGLQSL